MMAHQLPPLTISSTYSTPRPDSLFDRANRTTRIAQLLIDDLDVKKEPARPPPPPQQQQQQHHHYHQQHHHPHQQPTHRLPERNYSMQQQQQPAPPQQQQQAPPPPPPPQQQQQQTPQLPPIDPGDMGGMSTSEMSLREHLLAAQAGLATHRSDAHRPNSLSPQQRLRQMDSSSPQAHHAVGPGGMDAAMSGSGYGMAHVDHNAMMDDEIGPDGKRTSKRELSTSKRAAQNRAAQRAFRQRKEGYIKKLEEENRHMKSVIDESYAALQGENYQLRDYAITMQGRLSDYMPQSEIPQPQGVQLRDSRTGEPLHHQMAQMQQAPPSSAPSSSTTTLPPPEVEARYRADRDQQQQHQQQQQQQQQQQAMSAGAVSQLQAAAAAAASSSTESSAYSDYPPHPTQHLHPQQHQHQHQQQLPSVMERRDQMRSPPRSRDEERASANGPS